MLTVYRGGETITVEITWGAVPADQQTQEAQAQQDSSQNGSGYTNPFDIFDYFFR